MKRRLNRLKKYIGLIIFVLAICTFVACNSESKAPNTDENKEPLTSDNTTPEANSSDVEGTITQEETVYVELPQFEKDIKEVESTILENSGEFISAEGFVKEEASVFANFYNNTVSLSLMFDEKEHFIRASVNSIPSEESAEGDEQNTLKLLENLLVALEPETGIAKIKKTCLSVGEKLTAGETPVRYETDHSEIFVLYTPEQSTTLQVLVQPLEEAEA